ncbi:MAG TPA: transglutaminase family protein [Rhodocyclaceae bacterium]|nr:transglutaminase family protein [Zoogloeaceae bacterium]HRD35209.1 transglutaminase family protein [Rhodocyclaceae bacterium]
MSTFIEVEHVTTYRYAQPVEFSKHRVMFRPRAAHDIRVLNATLDVEPASRQHWVHDVFSNSVTIVEPLVPAEELRFTARFTIEHFGLRNLELEVDPEARDYPFQYSPDDQLDLATYLPLQYPEDAPVVSEWVKQFLPARGVIHSRDLLRNIAAGIRADLSYQAREAMGTQRPAETLGLMGGTCRDYALLMMEAARGLGLAARFVSGYLYDPALDGAAPVELGTGLQQGMRQMESHDGCDPVQGAGATHAWLDVFLPGAGWVPFDPTNGIFGGTDLIRVAFTRTPEQAAPVSGGWMGAASDYLGMSVKVNVRHIDAETAYAGERDAVAVQAE